jgi:hypothetical protein
MAQHNSSVFPYSSNGDRRRLLHGSTTSSFFFCFKGLMSGAETWAGSMSPLTQLVCTPVTPPIARAGSERW